MNESNTIEPRYNANELIANTIFKGEFALSNNDKYVKYFASLTEQRLHDQDKKLPGEADADSLESDSDQ